MAVHAFWGRLEQWPDQQSRDFALERIEDHYSVFAPTVLCEEELSLKDVLTQVAATKKSAQGMDGWKVQEIKSLPDMAWSHLLELWPMLLPAFALSPLARFKRFPLEKRERGPHETRGSPTH